ncbi:MAG: hypothetical protein ABIG95_01705 [Candidatus Woesearchaeota archaeon]
MFKLVGLRYEATGVADPESIKKCSVVVDGFTDKKLRPVHVPLAKLVKKFEDGLSIGGGEFRDVNALLGQAYEERKHHNRGAATSCEYRKLYAACGQTIPVEVMREICAVEFTSQQDLPHILLTLHHDADSIYGIASLSFPGRSASDLGKGKRSNMMAVVEELTKACFSVTYDPGTIGGLEKVSF